MVSAPVVVYSGWVTRSLVRVEPASLLAALTAVGGESEAHVWVLENFQSVRRLSGGTGTACVPIPNCLNRGVHPKSLCPLLCPPQIKEHNR